MDQDLAWTEFCKALEELMDAADDAWEMDQQCLYRQRLQIQEERYDPAKQRMRECLDSYIDRRISGYVSRQKTNAEMSYSNDIYDL